MDRISKKVRKQKVAIMCALILIMSIGRGEAIMSIDPVLKCEGNSDCGWCEDTCISLTGQMICNSKVIQNSQCICVDKHCKAIEQKISIHKKPQEVTITLQKSVLEPELEIMHNANLSISLDNVSIEQVVQNNISIITNSGVVMSTFDVPSVNISYELKSNLVRSENVTQNIKVSAVENSAPVIDEDEANLTPRKEIVLSDVYTILQDSGITPIKGVETRVIKGEKVYSVKGIKRVKLLGIIPIDMGVEVRIDPTGEIKDTKEPWWKFLVL